MTAVEVGLASGAAQSQPSTAPCTKGVVKRALRTVAVDDALPSVGSARENEEQETTSETTPGQRRWNADRGPRRPTGDDRLMHTVSSLAIDAPAVCPTCGKSAEGRTVRTANNVCTGDYRCSSDHIWTTRWMAV